MSECFKIESEVVSRYGDGAPPYDLKYKIEISHQGPIEMVAVEVEISERVTENFWRTHECKIKFPYCTNCGFFVKGGGK